MTWELRSAVAMGMAHIALVMVVVASTVGGAAQALAIESGKLQAVPSNSPPVYLSSSSHHPAAWPFS